MLIEWFVDFKWMVFVRYIRYKYQLFWNFYYIAMRQPVKLVVAEKQLCILIWQNKISYLSRGKKRKYRKLLNLMVV